MTTPDVSKQMVWPTAIDFQKLTISERIVEAARLVAEAHERRGSAAGSSLSYNQERALQVLAEAMTDAGYVLRTSWTWGRKSREKASA